jgi:hypothetical protein
MSATPALGRPEVLGEEVLDEPPARHGGLGPVRRPVDGEEPVPGLLEAVEAVRLAQAGQDPVELADLRRGGVAVVGPEQPEQRCLQLWSRLRRLRIDMPLPSGGSARTNAP